MVVVFSKVMKSVFTGVAFFFGPDPADGLLIKRYQSDQNESPEITAPTAVPWEGVDYATTGLELDLDEEGKVPLENIAKEFAESAYFWGLIDFRKLVDLDKEVHNWLVHSYLQSRHLKGSVGGVVTQLKEMLEKEKVNADRLAKQFSHKLGKKHTVAADDIDKMREVVEKAVLQLENVRYRPVLIVQAWKDRLLRRKRYEDLKEKFPKALQEAVEEAKADGLPILKRRDYLGGCIQERLEAVREEFIRKGYNTEDEINFMGKAWNHGKIGQTIDALLKEGSP